MGLYLAGCGKDLGHGRVGCRFALVWQNFLRITRKIFDRQTNPVRDILEIQYPGEGCGGGGQAFSGWERGVKRWGDAGGNMAADVDAGVTPEATWHRRLTPGIPRKRSRVAD